LRLKCQKHRDNALVLTRGAAAKIQRIEAYARIMTAQLWLCCGSDRGPNQARGT